MTPGEIRSETLKQLRQTLLIMLSPEWDVALQGKSKKLVTQASVELLRVQRARLQLANAELSEIRDDLIANEADLEKARDRLVTALDGLQRTKNVVNAVSAFVDVVTKVVAIV
jgi:ABC-type phosphate transport system auxiliary subunit